MGPAVFEPGCAYDNVYFLFVDAAGYSSIVRTNPRDRAALAFDLLRDLVVRRVTDLAAARGCARAALWSWRGDGGFLVVHDDEESAALDVVLEAGLSTVSIDLPQLRDELKRLEVSGELHLRIAVHKGPIRFSQENDTGSIHSPDINFAAHLEEATPRDCLAISEDVFRVSGRFADAFEPVGSFESRGVYLASTGRNNDGRRAWLTTAGLAGGLSLHAYPQRPSQLEKARIVDVAEQEILDLGTALNTCSGYLVTTERPAHYRDAVLRFLGRGGTYRCVLLAAESEATRMFEKLRGDELTTKIQNSIAKFRRFKKRYGELADNLEVYQAERFSGMAALCADLHSPDAIILYSPYIFSADAGRSPMERADMPHYLATAESGALFTSLIEVVRHASGEQMTRVL